MILTDGDEDQQHHHHHHQHDHQEWRSVRHHQDEQE